MLFMSAPGAHKKHRFKIIFHSGAAAIVMLNG
jgi:hypothetical protein